MTLLLNSRDVEAIRIPHPRPCRHEVFHELLLRVRLCVKLGDGSELGVRAEDEVDGGAGPLGLARGAVATLVHVLIRAGCLPLRAHVEQGSRRSHWSTSQAACLVKTLYLDGPELTPRARRPEVKPVAAWQSGRLPSQDFS